MSYVDGASKCYSCSGSECVLAEQTCASSFSFCKTVITTTSGFPVFIKGCSDSCKDGLVESFGPTTIVYKCCSTDFCNSSTRKYNLQFENLWFIVFIGINAFDCASQCYSCNGPDCSEPTIEVCGSRRSNCQKIVTQTAGVKVFVKGCADICTSGDEFKFGYTQMNYYCCKDDLCNSSSKSSNSYLINILTILLVCFSFWIF
ncbi:hypothetical protein BpHYR1_004325 [Brachionus plicatilis]|uniref:UPAR/Ly6 domain-containing protein n=1 Tax=Brachionus plicatilis TaxID=10195 RepID=A0A3M7SEF5_BRAPC|nr:hypothetical protein BpHYR1_004325 [Brachionus plicatilis]